MKEIIPTERIEGKIILLRGYKVILDSDLAELYGIPTKRLNEQVKRNPRRFPADFTFRLTLEEKNKVVAKCDHLQHLKFSAALPYAFTEHGAIMAANVIKSDKAADVSIIVVRTFVKLRKELATHIDLTQKLKDLENTVTSHNIDINMIFQAIRSLMDEPEKPRERIGFRKK